MDTLHRIPTPDTAAWVLPVRPRSSMKKRNPLIFVTDNVHIAYTPFPVDFPSFRDHQAQFQSTEDTPLELTSQMKLLNCYFTTGVWKAWVYLLYRRIRIVPTDPPASPESFRRLAEQGMIESNYAFKVLTNKIKLYISSTCPISSTSTNTKKCTKRANKQQSLSLGTKKEVSFIHTRTALL